MFGNQDHLKRDQHGNLPGSLGYAAQKDLLIGPEKVRIPFEALKNARDSVLSIKVSENLARKLELKMTSDAKFHLFRVIQDMGRLRETDLLMNSPITDKIVILILISKLLDDHLITQMQDTDGGTVYLLVPNSQVLPTS